MPKGMASMWLEVFKWLDQRTHTCFFGCGVCRQQGIDILWQIMLAALLAMAALGAWALPTEPLRSTHPTH